MAKPMPQRPMPGKSAMPEGSPMEEGQESPGEENQEQASGQGDKNENVSDFFVRVDAELGKALALLQSAKGIAPDALKQMQTARSSFQNSIRALTGSPSQDQDQGQSPTPGQAQAPGNAPQSSMEAANNPKAVPAY